jgi:hypothetical protein
VPAARLPEQRPFRGLRELRGPRRRHRRRENHRGVTVPCRVLAGDKVAGCWVPCSRSGLGTRGARPIRFSFLRPCPGTRLPERSSRGVQPSFMVCPEIPAPRLSTEAPLLGFLRPYSVRGRESPRPARRLTTPGPASPALPGWCASGSLAASYGAARRFSQPLDGLFLSRPARHFQAGDAHGVLPTGGCSSR